METDSHTMSIAGGAIGAAAGGAITLAMVPQVEGTPVYVLSIAGTLSLLGAISFLLSYYLD